MIDLKYHIYSLAAVFVALATGVLVGIGLSGGPAGHSKAITRQSQAIQRLNEQFRHYSEKLSLKQASLDHLYADLNGADALARGWLPGIVKGTLAGRGVAVVQLGEAEDLVSPVRRALLLSGATVNSVVKIDTGFGFDNAAKMQKVAQSIPLEFQDPGKEPYQQVWGYIASVLTKGRPGKAFEALQSTGLLQVREGDCQKPNHFVVILAPSDPGDTGMMDLAFTPLVEKLKQSNAELALATPAAPPGDKGESPWRQADVATVTHANMTFGQICLVEALVKGEGHYGLGPSEEFLPRRLLAK